MKGFIIEKVQEKSNCSIESFPEKILKIPSVALVAAGSFSCIRSLYQAAAKENALDRLFLCRISSVEYGLGKQGKKIWEAVKKAEKIPGIQGILIYASCMEILTMWDFQTEKKKEILLGEVPVEILYRGPLVKRFLTPMDEWKNIQKKWKLEETTVKTIGKNKVYDKENLPMPYFEKEIRRLSKKDCDILLVTPGGCKSCLEELPKDMIKNLWNTRFTDYFLSTGNLNAMVRTIKEKFPQRRPLYLLDSAVPYFMGMDLEKVAYELRQIGKETYYIPGQW